MKQKNNTNEITIDPEKIRMLPDNSVTDVETIRQIALSGDRSLFDKVKAGFEYAGLYPHVMTSFDIVPEIPRKDEST